MRGWNSWEACVDKIKRIRLIVCDVDGTLTDGSIFINEKGEEAKLYSAHDGLAANMWVKWGGKLALITGRGESGTVQRRAKETSCFRVVFGSKDKATDILDVCKQADISPDETAFLGDDLPDIRAMKRVAVSFAVMNATGEVRESADIVLSSTGGHGALREVIENIMKIQGRWDEALKEYFD